MKLERVDLNLLPVLDAVLTSASVSKAAAVVGLSKPATSHALARIREQIGDPVLVRAGQKWMLTERAEAIAPRVRAVLSEARALLSADRPFDPKVLRREFRIHATDQMLSLVGLGIGHAAAAEAPRVALQFVPIPSDLPGALRTEADLALGVFRELPPELRTQKLFDDHFACIVRIGHPQLDGPLTLETFLAMRHVVVSEETRTDNVVDDALAERRLARRAVRWVPYAMSAIESVAESDCVAILSGRLARKFHERFALEVLAPPLALPPCSASQVWHSRLEADPAHTWLRRLVLRIAGERRSKARAQRESRARRGPGSPSA